MKLTPLLVALAIVNASAGRSYAAAAVLSGWMAEEDPPSAFAALIANSAAVEAVWGRSLTVAADGRSLSAAETPAMQAVHAARRAGSGRYGSMLHNSGPNGFSAGLAENIFAHQAELLPALRTTAQRLGWTAFNVDLEALPATDAAAYEAFLDAVIATFAGLDVRVSVALHARTGPVPDSDLSRFQRWNVLARKNIDPVVMAYDYSWSTSAPGPVAPLAWVKAAAAYAVSVFGSERTVVALPLYGYHWRQKPGGEGWRGASLLAPQLRAVVVGAPGFAADKTLTPADGALFRRGTDDAVAFDDDDSVVLKWRALAASGIRRVAVWRFGGEAADFYRRVVLP